MTLRERIRRHEGCVAKPYQDSLGIWTVGVGRNLEAAEFSQDEIDLMFENDLERATHGADMLCPYLEGVRREVLIEMVFQLGVGGVSRFKKFLAAASSHQWEIAADEMLNSRWHEQTPERAEELAELMRTG